MQVSRLVNFRRQHPRPFLHDFPDTDKEVRMLADWVVGMVDDLVDDSIEFIGEELIRAGLKPDVVPEVKQRVSFGLISQWAQWVLERYRDQTEGPELVSDEEIQLFIKRKFGIEMSTPKHQLPRLVLPREGRR